MIKDDKEEVVFLKKPVCLEPNVFSFPFAVVQLEDGKRTNRVDLYKEQNFYSTRVIHEDAYESITQEEFNLIKMLYLS